MKPALIDTDILSLFLRGNLPVTTRFGQYLSQYPTIVFSVITYYEIISGLKHRDAKKQLSGFLAFAAQSTIAPLSESSVLISADIYAELRQKGTPVDDIDLLIAGIALAEKRILVTHNRKHFDRIPALSVEDWSSAG